MGKKYESKWHRHFLALKYLVSFKHEIFTGHTQASKTAKLFKSDLSAITSLHSQIL